MNKGESTANNRSNILVICLIVAIVSFAAGTRSEQIWGTVGSMLGLRVETGELNLESVQETYKTLKTNFDGDLDIEKLVYGANRGLVEAANDPHTAYLDPVDAKELESDISGNIGGGIGAEIGKRNEKLTVIRPLKDSPAAKSGVRAGDIILAVNDQPAQEWTVEQVVQKIRGEIGTKVVLTLQREDKDVMVEVTRQEIVSPTVEASINGKTGILKVSRFNEETGPLARTEAVKFINQGVDKVILDLRGNPGGEVNAAQALSSLWLENEVLITYRRGGEITNTLKSKGSPILGNTKTIVLIDGSSASASEIIAGALKEYGKATLVGEKTYGKGSVQAVIKLGPSGPAWFNNFGANSDESNVLGTLNDGALLKVTESRWYTPKGKNIDKEGIKPDVEVELTADDFNAGRDPQLDRAMEL